MGANRPILAASELREYPHYDAFAPACDHSLVRRRLASARSRRESVRVAAEHAARSLPRPASKTLLTFALHHAAGDDRARLLAEISRLQAKSD